MAKLNQTQQILVYLIWFVGYYSHHISLQFVPSPADGAIRTLTFLLGKQYSSTVHIKHGRKLMWFKV